MEIISSKNLSRPPVAYKGLTKNEMFFQAIVGTLTTTIICVLVGMLFGYMFVPGVVGFFLGALLSWLVFPKMTMKTKGELPSDAFIKKIRLEMANFGIGTNPYIHYQGLWNKSKKVKR